jgi:hypothetical protein
MSIDLPGARVAAAELDAYSADVARASHQTLTNAIQRYVKRLDAEPLAAAVDTVLPHVGFDAWYAAALGTIKSMVGSGKLNWPPDAPERVAMQAELLRRMAGGQIDPIQYTYNFHYVENRFSSNIAQFIAQDFEPFHRDLRRLLDAAFAAPTQPPALSETETVIVPIPYSPVLRLLALNTCLPYGLPNFVLYDQPHLILGNSSSFARRSISTSASSAISELRR